MPAPAGAGGAGVRPASLHPAQPGTHAGCGRGRHGGKGRSPRPPRPGTAALGAGSAARVFAPLSSAFGNWQEAPSPEREILYFFPTSPGILPPSRAAAHCPVSAAARHRPGSRGFLGCGAPSPMGIRKTQHDRPKAGPRVVRPRLGLILTLSFSPRGRLRHRAVQKLSQWHGRGAGESGRPTGPPKAAELVCHPGRVVPSPLLPRGLGSPLFPTRPGPCRQNRKPTDSPPLAPGPEGLQSQSLMTSNS